MIVDHIQTQQNKGVNIERVRQKIAHAGPTLLAALVIALIAGFALSSGSVYDDGTTPAQRAFEARLKQIYRTTGGDPARISQEDLSYLCKVTGWKQEVVMRYLMEYSKRPGR